jgi:hypothetical protein
MTEKTQPTPTENTTIMPAHTCQHIHASTYMPAHT